MPGFINHNIAQKEVFYSVNIKLFYLPVNIFSFSFSDNRIVDICQNIDFETREVFISSTNFPQNYPPELDCSCFVSSSGSGALVHLEVVYMSILYSFPCRDWLRVGRTRMCGITVDLFSGQHIPLEFHSDKEGGHSGFWLQMQGTYVSVF